jgi:GH24 family phage-related lysozyme (muramidase)
MGCHCYVGDLASLSGEFMSNKLGQSAIAGGRPNAGMSMSPAAKAKMLVTEKPVYEYYNDLGPQLGNCTWGAGILVHRGVCRPEELGKKVSAAAVSLEYNRRVAIAEQIVRRGIEVSLNQAQFDALCSLAYNAGPRGVTDTFRLINNGDFDGAAANMSKMIKATIDKNGKKVTVIVPGLIKRRAEESAPFRSKPVNAH